MAPKAVATAYTGQEFKDQGGAGDTLVKLGLFVFFVFTRAVHPTIIDASKSVDPETGKKYFAYGNMTVVLGETFVTIAVAQAMCLVLGGQKQWRQIWDPKPMKIFSLIGFLRESSLRPPAQRRASRLAAQVLATAGGCFVASQARRSCRSAQTRCVRCAAPAEPEAYPPAVIIGGGRLGEAFAKMGLGNDVIVRRGEAFPTEAPKGPIYVCTRNDALEGVIAAVPEDRHEDLIFVQNGVLMPFLRKQLKPDLPLTILLVYFAVAKKGEPPLDGKTDTDPEGLSAVNAGGKWAREVHWRLTSSTVGEVESQYRSEVDELIAQLATAVYALGDYLEMASMGSLGGAAYQILLQSKLVITALMMWGIKGTKQTALQWNILILVMFSMCVYMLGGKSDSGGGGIPIAGVMNVLLKVTVSCLCAVLSDKYMKDFKDEPIYMQLVQFKCAWCATILMISFADGHTWQNGFFNGWDTTTVGVLASFTVKGWSTMYLLALLDSVLKNIGEACAVLVIYVAQVALPAFDDKFEVPTFLSVMVVILSVTAYVGAKPVVEKAQKFDAMKK
eukprot:symbB.v1.2.005248.t2/scaffold304.1/size234131/7